MVSFFEGNEVLLMFSKLLTLQLLCIFKALGNCENLLKKNKGPFLNFFFVNQLINNFRSLSKYKYELLLFKFKLS